MTGRDWVEKLFALAEVDEWEDWDPQDVVDATEMRRIRSFGIETASWANQWLELDDAELGKEAPAPALSRNPNGTESP